MHFALDSRRSDERSQFDAYRQFPDNFALPPGIPFELPAEVKQ